MPATVLAILTADASISPCALALCVRTAPPVQRFIFFGFLMEWELLTALRQHCAGCATCRELVS